MQNSESNWQDLEPQKRMEYLLNTGHLSDCSFVVYDDDGQKIVLKCHKFVLMSASPVFERMFDGDFEEANMPDNIVLDDVSGPDFKKFISYLYWHDNHSLDAYELKSLQSLIYLSKKFMLSLMTKECLKVIKRRLDHGLNMDVTIDLYEYAHQLDDIDLIKRVVSKMLTNPTAYINTSAVFDLSSDIFSKFIAEFYGSINEKFRFHAIDRYCTIQGLAPRLESTSSDKTLNSILLNDCVKQKENIKKLNNIVVNEDTEKLADKKDENENEVENCSEPPSDTTEKDQSVERWNKEREQRKKEKYITDILQSIQYKSMSAYDFCSGPGVSNLLSLEKKYELLSTICIANQKNGSLFRQ